MKTDKGILNGYVLITTDPGKKKIVYDKILKISGVEEATPLFAEWDILVKIEAVDFKEIDNIGIKKIKTINGVSDIKILKCIKF